MDSPADENHVLCLVKSITQCYSKIRLHHLAKEATATSSGPNVRKSLLKLELFKHQ